MDYIDRLCLEYKPLKPFKIYENNLKDLKSRINGLQLFLKVFIREGEKNVSQEMQKFINIAIEVLNSIKNKINLS